MNSKSLLQKSHKISLRFYSRANLSFSKPNQEKNVKIDNNAGDNTFQDSTIPLSHPQLPHLSKKLPYLHPTATSSYYSPPTTASHPTTLNEPTVLTEKHDNKQFLYEYTRSRLPSSLPGTVPKYMEIHNMKTEWTSYEEAQKRKNDPNRSPSQSWKIPAYKRYKTQRKLDIANFSNSNISIIDALKYNNGPALLRLNGGEGDLRIQIFRKMEAAAQEKNTEETFRLYGEFHGKFPNEPRSTYMGNLLLELCQGQHPSRVRYLMSKHFTWNVYNQEEEELLAPQNLETFRLACAAYASTGFYQDLDTYFQHVWRFFGPDLVTYHIILRNTLSAPNGLFLKWFKQLFQSNLGNNGKRNPRRIQPTLETWKLLILYEGGYGNFKAAMNIYNHLKAFHIFKHGWEAIEKELTYTFNTAVIQSQTLTNARRDRLDELISNYYNTVKTDSITRFPQKAYNTVLYPTYSLPLNELLEKHPHEANDLTKINVDSKMVFDTGFYNLIRGGFSKNPFKVIKYFKTQIRWTRNSEEHHHTTIYANKLLREMFKRDLRLGFKFLTQNYDLKNETQINKCLDKLICDAKWISRLPRGGPQEARARNVSRYWSHRKRKALTWLKGKEVLSLLPSEAERQPFENENVTFAKVIPNEATFAIVLFQAYKIHRNLVKYNRDKILNQMQKLSDEINSRADLSINQKTVLLQSALFPVAVEGSPIVWAFLDELGVQSVEGGQWTTLGGYFEKLYGTKPIPGSWFPNGRIAQELSGHLKPIELSNEIIKNKFSEMIGGLSH